MGVQGEAGSACSYFVAPRSADIIIITNISATKRISGTRGDPAES